MSSLSMYSTDQLGRRSSLHFPHSGFQRQRNSDQPLRLCSNCAKLPLSHGHCIDFVNSKNYKYMTCFKNLFYVMPSQNAKPVVLMSQETNSSNSAWSEKIGAWALLYFAQVSRHLMPSDSGVSKRTLALSGLK